MKPRSTINGCDATGLLAAFRVPGRWIEVMTASAGRSSRWSARRLGLTSMRLLGDRSLRDRGHLGVP